MRGLRKNLIPFFKKSWPIGLLIIIVLGFFWKFFLKGDVPLPGDFITGVYYPWLDYKWGFITGVPVKNPIATDVVSLIYPEQILAINLLKSKILPLWNPYILAGTPLFANLQAAPFSPTNFLYFLTDNLTAWSFQIVLQHVLVAIFTYLLLRHWKVSKLASVLGGIIFAFSGFNLIFSQWNGHTLTSAFIPLIILFQDRWFKNGKFLDGALVSLGLTLQLLSGYPQTSLYTAIIMALLWLFSMKRERKFWIRTVEFGIFLLFALGLAAIQVLPTSELWKLSQRDFEPHPYEWAFLPWKKTITTIAVDYFGNHATHNYWGPQDYTSNTLFVGVVAIFLSFVSLSSLRKKKEILFLSVVAIVSLILSYPTPVSTFLWEKNIFGMRAASAHRATIMFDFAVAILAGFGLDAFFSKPKFKFKLVGFVVPLLLILLFAFWAFLIRDKTINGASVFPIALRNLVLPTFVLVVLGFLMFVRTRIVGVLFIVLSIGELFYFGWKYTPFSPRRIVFPTTPVLDFLTSQSPPFRVTGNKVVPVNMRTPYKLESLEGYETIHPLRISQFLAALNSGRSGTDPVGRYGTVDNDTSPLLDLVNTKYYLALKTDERGNPDLTGEIPERFKQRRFMSAFEDKTVTVLESKNTLPRAFMVYDWEVISEDNQILDRLLDPKFSVKDKIILEEEPPLSRGISQGTVTYLTYKEQESSIQVETNSSGLLFISDSFYPGWRAYVDDVETKIYRADFAFRGIVVPKGKHMVKMVYQPDSFYNGLKISIATLFILVATFFVRKLFK